MTNEQLQAFGIDAKWLQPLNDTFAKYGIDTPKRQAAFIGQAQHIQSPPTLWLLGQTQKFSYLSLV